jgi:hypothetical protein
MAANGRRAAMHRLPVIATMLVVLTGCGWQPPARPEQSPPSGSLSTSPGTPVVESPGATPSGEPVPSVVTVETRGGECPEGTCESVIEIEADGRLHQIKPAEAVLATVPPELMEALRVEIDQADFALIESRPFTDTCPMAYDGQEVIYVFDRGPLGLERIASCDVMIDDNHPLFRAVAAVLALR